MTVLLVMLAVILLAAVALAAELLRTDRDGVQGASGQAQAGAAAPRSYEPMLRLFAHEDFQTVRADPGLSKRLQASRRRALRLYLGALRGDFLAAWAVCRTLSPVSQDSSLVMRLARHWLAFHGLFALVWLRSSFGFSMALAVDVEAMIRSARELKAGAAQLLEVQHQLEFGGSAA